MKIVTLSLAVMLAAVVPSFGAGLLTPVDGSQPPLRIKEHKVDVVVNNGFAVTEVDQTFLNPHDVDLEAIYSFPLPKNASLSELTLWIDGQEVVGEVVEKQRARDVYGKEKQSGRDTALAEKREYLAFDVMVSPVRARAETRVRIVYLQPLEIDNAVGRYVYPLEEGNIDEDERSFWSRLPQVHGTFSFQCLIRTAYPLDDVRVKGFDHLTKVTQSAPDTWIVNIEDTAGKASLDQDIVVYYRFDESLPARVDLLAHRKPGEEGTFLVVVTPGADLQPIVEGVDWSIVLDVSGSMSGKIAQAAAAVSRALDEMRPDDRFRVVAFSDSARAVMGGWTPVTPGAVDEASRRLSALAIDGGTNVYAGLLEGLRDLEADRTSAVILVSDGGANVGPKDLASFLALLGKHDVRVFTFVMGQGANQPLLEGIAKASGGFAMNVSNQDDLYGRVLLAREKLAREALHGVRLTLEGVPVTQVAPEQLPSAYQGEQIAIFGRYLRPGVATLRLSGRISGAERSWETSVVLPEQEETYPELERLWALARIEDFQTRIDRGGNERESRAAIVSLGTAYSIVTDHTSMVVVRPEMFEQHGIDRTNRDRVENERQAREGRLQQYAVSPRADAGNPMFGQRSAPRTGGGAAGPVFVGLLAGLLGLREAIRRRSSR